MSTQERQSRKLKESSTYRVVPSSSLLQAVGGLLASRESFQNSMRETTELEVWLLMSLRCRRLCAFSPCNFSRALNARTSRWLGVGIRALDSIARDDARSTIKLTKAWQLARLAPILAACVSESTKTSTGSSHCEFDLLPPRSAVTRLLIWWRDGFADQSRAK